MVRGRLCCGAVRGWRRIGFVGDFVAYIRSGAVRFESSVPKGEGQDIGRSRLVRAHPSPGKKRRMGHPLHALGKGGPPAGRAVRCVLPGARREVRRRLTTR